MGKISNGRYTKEFREEAPRLVIKNDLSIGEAVTRISLSKRTLEAWVRAAKTGKLGDVGKKQTTFDRGRSRACQG
ncbi:MAG: transposase [Chlorobium sp.]|nr:transposase [Chlorobium sp.]